ncbi:YggS family pyridoxal phosphate enzyme [Cupriavidus sp. TKC]|uniref:YggS family pyridoxal phosphate-dependent enzyme n=1 Tax=Cupriavidus TaxID=106589 RepID=UPI000560C662|nr:MULTISPECIES: YggS family pyridoxal phosphate-dependent enzyme [Cupriavidus]GMG91174.1 YggS family pyridoxal phosphate enzyme [Cupriavidus sp. TKC]HBD39786.1 YggS family pyridoxal phosphate-dependent enzyme [Cupriavidus sp.]
MSVIAANLQAVKNDIAAAAQQADRDPSGVTLLAVSKTVSPDRVREAFEAGQPAFGENYVQEGLDKIAALGDLRSRIAWHFIGPLQSNKTRPVAEQFDWVHAIDRLKIAERLSAQRPANLAPLQVCIQVNISNEDTKSGVLPEEVLPLARAVAALPNLQLRGLMAIPAPAADLAAQRVPFAALRRLLEELRQSGLDVDTLSMGMSADMPAAIAEGATMVRIGTAIFGARG